MSMVHEPNNLYREYLFSLRYIETDEDKAGSCDARAYTGSVYSSMISIPDCNFLLKISPALM